jgi:hypothetical protein
VLLPDCHQGLNPSPPFPILEVRIRDQRTCERPRLAAVSKMPTTLQQTVCYDAGIDAEAMTLYPPVQSKPLHANSEDWFAQYLVDPQLKEVLRIGGAQNNRRVCAVATTCNS